MRRLPVEDKTNSTQCAQCGSREPESGFAAKDVIHQKMNWQTRKKFVGITRQTVCKGTPCGARLQMAYEG